MPPLDRNGYLGGSITAEDAPNGVTSRGAAPSSLPNTPLNKRVKEYMCVRSKAATVLYRKWDQSVLPPMDPDNKPF